MRRDRRDEAGDGSANPIQPPGVKNLAPVTKGQVVTETCGAHPILSNLFRQNRWANLTLIDVCAAADAAVIDADAPGTLGTIRRTLWHLVGTENHFRAALQGHPDAGHIPDLAGYDGDLGTLRAHAARIGNELIAWAEQADSDPMLTGAWFDGPYRAPASMFVTQAVLHGTEHRVQVCEALERFEMASPDLDAWTWWELSDSTEEPDAK